MESFGDRDYGSEKDFQALQEKIIRDTGWDCSRFKCNYLKRRIATRMRALNLDSYTEYRNKLEEEPGEYIKLKDRLTVNVTGFFRDEEVYTYLRKEILPQVLESHRRAWKDSGEKGDFNPQITLCLSSDFVYC